MAQEVGECKDCQEWKMYLFWTKFESTEVHFFVKVLQSGFQEKLVLEKKYLSGLRTDISGTVVLKGPGEDSLDVELVECGDEVHVQQGWVDFSRDHFLKENDIIVLRYDQHNNSCIHILLFDHMGFMKEGSETVLDSENIAPIPIEVSNTPAHFSSVEDVENSDQNVEYHAVVPMEVTDAPEISLEDKVENEVKELRPKARGLGVCEDCIERKTHHLWTLFESIQVHFFVKVLQSGCHEKLVLPHKYVRELRDDISGMVVLKGPSEDSWDVELDGCRDEVYIRQGWEKFARHHSLVENDMLVFRYDHSNDSCIHVLFFYHDGFQKKGSDRVNEDLGLIPVEKKDGEILMAEPLQVCTPNDQDHSWDSQRMPVTRSRTTRTSQLALTEVNNSGMKGESSRRPNDDNTKKINRRRQNAIDGTTKIGFVTVLKPTHVCRAFFMTIPPYVMACIPEAIKNAILHVRDTEKTWKVGILRRAHGSSGISKGWRKFALENNLKEGDTCMFELDEVEEGQDSVRMAVSIRRSDR